jgi:hypothetical protein
MQTQLDVGDVLGRSFGVWTSNLFSFAAIAILFSIPFIVIQASPALFGAPQPAAYVGQFGNFMVGQIVTGLIALAVFQALSRGEADIGRSMSVAFSKFGSLLIASIVVAIATGVGMMMCVVPGVFAAILFSVVIPAVVVEKLGPMDALSRSVNLTEGHRMQIFLVFLVVGLVYAVVFGGIFCVSGVVMADSMQSGGFQAGQQPGGPTIGLIQVGGGILGALVMTFQATLGAVIYKDLREIKEGTGVDDLVDVFS